MSAAKILTAVVIVVAVTETVAKLTVQQKCNYNIGGPKCSACCGRALRHCRLYCKNIGCNQFEPGVCDVKDSNKYFMYSFKAKGCDTCMNNGRRTLEDNDEPSSYFASARDLCNICEQHALESCRASKCQDLAVWTQRLCENVC